MACRATSSCEGLLSLALLTLFTLCLHQRPNSNKATTPPETHLVRYLMRVLLPEGHAVGTIPSKILLSWTESLFSHLQSRLPGSLPYTQSSKRALNVVEIPPNLHELRKMQRLRTQAANESKRNLGHKGQVNDSPSARTACMASSTILPFPVPCITPGKNGDGFSRSESPGVS